MNDRIRNILVITLFALCAVYVLYEMHWCKKLGKARAAAADAERKLFETQEREEKQRTANMKAAVELLAVKPVPPMQFRWPWEKIKK